MIVWDKLTIANATNITGITIAPVQANTTSYLGVNSGLQFVNTANKTAVINHKGVYLESDGINNNITAAGMIVTNTSSQAVLTLNTTKINFNTNQSNMSSTLSYDKLDIADTRLPATASLAASNLKFTSLQDGQSYITTLAADKIITPALDVTQVKVGNYTGTDTEAAAHIRSEHVQFADIDYATITRCTLTNAQITNSDILNYKNYTELPTALYVDVREMYGMNDLIFMVMGPDGKTIELRVTLNGHSSTKSFNYNQVYVYFTDTKEMQGVDSFQIEYQFGGIWQSIVQVTRDGSRDSDGWYGSLIPFSGLGTFTVPTPWQIIAKNFIFAPAGFGNSTPKYNDFKHNQHTAYTIYTSSELTGASSVPLYNRLLLELMKRAYNKTKLISLQPKSIQNEGIFMSYVPFTSIPTEYNDARNHIYAFNDDYCFMLN